MIQYYLKQDGKIVEVPERVPACWINVIPPFSPTELNELSEELDIPLDFLTDSLDIDERSRYEREEDSKLILVNTPLLNENVKENEAVYLTIPIGIILTPENLLTISSRDNPVLPIFLEGRVKNFNPLDDKRFVLQLFEQIVFRFLACLKKLSLQRNIVEQELYDSSRSSDLKQLLRIEKSLVYFVNSLSSNDLLKMKMKRVDLLSIRDDEDLMDLFEDVIIDNSQALEMANVHTNILHGTMEAYASIISNNLNYVIQRLTLITIILMVPTLIASYYGMNFDWLPLANSSYGFLLVVVISIVLSLILAWIFRRRRLF
ncbi:MAG: magnesium transporter CorA family protein [Saprospiraceae bacterium]|nr:magnesium transporter CorA family protein [Saprospiraceae bacterium]